jgi:hypothetical protein
MRKLVLTLAALAAFGIALPVASNTANAETVVIKQNRGHHYGWRNHRAEKVVIVNKRHHRDRAVFHEGRRSGATVGVSVR